MSTSLGHAPSGRGTLEARQAHEIALTLLPAIEGRSRASHVHERPESTPRSGRPRSGRTFRTNGDEEPGCVTVIIAAP